jgi:predicted NAD/FAD-binding protein
MTDRFDEHLVCPNEAIKYALQQKGLNAARQARLEFGGFLQQWASAQTLLSYKQNRCLNLIHWKIYVKTLKSSSITDKQKVNPKNYRLPIPLFNATSNLRRTLAKLTIHLILYVTE